MPKVYNKRDRNCPKEAIYVGRPTKWGNPYKIGPDGDRDEVINKYRVWLATQIVGHRLDLAELKGKDLVCWCAPKPCHADILLKVANKEV